MGEEKTFKSLEDLRDRAVLIAVVSFIVAAILAALSNMYATTASDALSSSIDNDYSYSSIDYDSEYESSKAMATTFSFGQYIGTAVCGVAVALAVVSHVALLFGEGVDKSISQNTGRIIELIESYDVPLDRGETTGGKRFKS